jgi:hypothetical protein
MKRRVVTVTLFFLLTILAGCAATRATEVQRAPDGPPAPTTSAIFGRSSETDSGAATRAIANAEGAATPVSWFAEAEATPTAAPLPTPAETATPLASPTPPRMITTTIYADGLDSSWTLENSSWMQYEEQSEVVHSGDVALKFRPEEDFSSLFFTVSRGAREVFPYRQVMGVGFWLNAGDQELELDSLALTVVGSNEVSYWVAGDDSVQSQNDPIFSETRLYFLDFNQPFPANEWVYVELWLDDLVYDPAYEYVTGFYIKNDRGVFRDMYLDDLHLIMLEAPL